MDDATYEDQMYGQAAVAATTIQVILAEADNHHARMTSILDDMTVDMGVMMHRCSGMGAMVDVRESMLAELDAHVARVRSDEYVADAQREIESHVTAMTAMLADMSSLLVASGCP